jgi:hypothetical protein
VQDIHPLPTFAANDQQFSERELPSSYRTGGFAINARAPDYITQGIKIYPEDERPMSKTSERAA